MAVSMLGKTTAFRGIDPSRLVNYGSAIQITPETDGVWVVGGQSTASSPLPVIYARCNGQTVETVTGSNNIGDYVIACIPVKAGITYSVTVYRINVNTSLVYY